MKFWYVSLSKYTIYFKEANNHYILFRNIALSLQPVTEIYFIYLSGVFEFKWYHEIFSKHPFKRISVGGEIILIIDIQHTEIHNNCIFEISGISITSILENARFASCAAYCIHMFEYSRQIEIADRN